MVRLHSLDLSMPFVCEWVAWLDTTAGTYELWNCFAAPLIHLVIAASWLKELGFCWKAFLIAVIPSSL